MSKYPPLQEPCLSCIYKCFRVEEPTFITDKNCKYANKNIYNPFEKIREILGVQEKIDL